MPASHVTQSVSHTCDRTADPGELAFLTGADREWLSRSPLEVAPELLGLFLIAHGETSSDELVGGRIVEVEAYLGEADAASHAFRGETRRNRTMFGRPGLLYVYLSYGVHHCCNVVCLEKGRAGAVLVRALDPVFGLGVMERRRATRGSRRRPLPTTALCSGPGKLCQALAIDRSDDGDDLLAGGSRLRLARAPRPPTAVASGPRIGIAETLETAGQPWRFFDPDSPHVSRRARGAGSAGSISSPRTASRARVQGGPETG